MMRAVLVLLLALPVHAAGIEGLPGYYRQPALHGRTIVFHAEGDLWKVPADGGTAQRLTTHLERERFPVISPDGRTVAFTASYEGPTEIYTMPLIGGRPTRVTHDGVSGRRTPYAVGWKSPAELLYATWFGSDRDTMQLAVRNLSSGKSAPLPLAQASDGVFTPDHKTVYFTRLPRQGSFAKRYKGGLIEKLWRFRFGADEAEPLTADYEGTSRDPMIWKKRVYFASDRDGTMNIWSMDLDGKDLRQHTRFAGWDVLSPSMHRGRIVFQNQADIWIYHGAKDTVTKVPIRLATDFDQKRERWLDDPLNYLENYALSGDGKRIALTVRGRSFVAPVQGGRLVTIPQKTATRYREARFLPKSGDLYLLSDRSGEFEFWRYPSDGLGAGKRLTRDGRTMRYDGAPSPDGKFIAYTDRDQVLRLLEVATGKSREVARSREGNEWDRIDLSWSPDSRWIAFMDVGENVTARVFLYDTEGQAPPVPVTTDRLDSYSPAFSADGKWLYFLSDRTFRSLSNSPWGPRQPEPLLDRTTSIYLLDLVGGQKSPFAQPLESDPPGKSPEKKPEAEKKPDDDGGKGADDDNGPKSVAVKMDGLSGRLHMVPLEPGNYRGLTVGKAHLYFLQSDLNLKRRTDLVSFPITRKRTGQNRTVVVGEVRGYRLSGDRASLLVRKGNAFHVFPASGKAPPNFNDSRVDLGGLQIAVTPEEEWRLIFTDAWRMHRDYFYDPEMHQVDWNAMRRKHAALLPRVTSRWELDDLIGQMVGELSAMHTDISSGDVRDATDGSSMGYLGARLSRVKGGWRIDHIYRTDPDYPAEFAPVLRPGAELVEGDVIISVDGTPTLSVPDVRMLLRKKDGQQVFLEIRRPGEKAPRKAIVKPLGVTGFRNLKVSHWEYTRRLETEELGGGDIGYFHMRAMSSSSYAEFVKGYYPVHNRKGLVIDMRQNYGGNIDSWILNRLNRKPWMFWKTRTGRPFANMQFAFNGHMVVLVDAYTISDGEAFAEGFRRLGMGPLVGTKTWGGGIWLRSNTRLVDGGMARSPETGMYSPEGTWLVEGTGVEPDIVVYNMPHQSFLGKDAQLETAIAYLRKKIRENPPVIPDPPGRPDKSFDYPERR